MGYELKLKGSNGHFDAVAIAEDIRRAALEAQLVRDEALGKDRADEGASPFTLRSDVPGAWSGANGPNY